MQRPNTTDDFWRQVERTAGCWWWHGSTQRSQGGVLYGRFFWRGRRVMAHRFSWELHNDQPVPKGKLVCHTCDHPLCVRPGHLYVGTDKTNAEDRERRGRRDTRAGERHHNARLTQADVEAIRARYAAGGVTHSDLAIEYGVDRRHVGRLLRGVRWSDGTPARRVPRGRPPTLTPDRRAALIADYATGTMTQAEVAAKYGVSQGYVSKAVRH